MKTTATRIRLEKQFWLDLSRQANRLGYTCKWEIAGSEVSRQKVWNRIANSHQHGHATYYGFSLTIGRIGNHDLRLCLEMQDDLKMGLRFKEGFPYWTEEEIESWGELTFRLGDPGRWNFEQPGWFAMQKLPVRLHFRKEDQPAALDLFYYKDNSLVRLLLEEELSSRLFQVKHAMYKPEMKKIWSH